MALTAGELRRVADRAQTRLNEEATQRRRVSAEQHVRAEEEKFQREIGSILSAAIAAAQKGEYSISVLALSPIGPRAEFETRYLKLPELFLCGDVPQEVEFKPEWLRGTAKKIYEALLKIGVTITFEYTTTIFTVIDELREDEADRLHSWDDNFYWGPSSWIEMKIRW